MIQRPLHDRCILFLGALAFLILFAVRAQAEITVTGDFSPDEPFWSNGGSSSTTGYLGYENSGTATLRIDDGSSLWLDSGILGRRTGSTGNATVSGTGSQWNNAGVITVGLSGSGEILVEKGAQLTSDSGNISNGSIHITGTGSHWETGDLAIARFTPADTVGNLTISNGASVTSYQSLIGHFGFGSAGHATVTGNDSIWKIQSHPIIVNPQFQGDLFIGGGNSLRSTLSIQDGGRVEVDKTTAISGSTNYLSLQNGTLQTKMLIADRSHLKGTGNIQSQGLSGTGYSPLDFNGNSTANLLVNDQTDDIQITVNATDKSEISVDHLRIRNGATITTESVRIGRLSDEQGQAQVSGDGTTWINQGSIDVGRHGTGKAIIEKQAHLESLFINIGNNETATGDLRIKDSGTRVTAGSLQVGEEGVGKLELTEGATLRTGTANLGRFSGGDGTVNLSGEGTYWETDELDVGMDGIGTLTLGVGTQVDSGFHVNINSESEVNLYVSGDAMLNANTLGPASSGGDFENDGTVRLFAGQALAAGTYTPITVGADEGDFTGTGTYDAFGGIWNDAAHTFTVSSLLDGSGGIVETDLSGQRYEFSFGGDPEALLTASFGEGAGIADFSVLQLDPRLIGDQFTTTIFDFTTDLADGTDVMLSYFVGADFDEEAIAFWHSEDGLAWTLYTPDTWVYADGWVSFLVDGFSGYAVTVPEPATGSLLLGAGAVWLLRRRKRQSEVGFS